MTEIKHWIESVAHTDIDGVTWYEHILHIVITQRTAGEQADVYRFNNNQREVPDEGIYKFCSYPPGTIIT